MATDCLFEAQKTLTEAHGVLTSAYARTEPGLGCHNLVLIGHLERLSKLLNRTQELLMHVGDIEAVRPSQEIQQLLKDVEYARKHLTQMAGAPKGSNGGLAYLAEAMTLVRWSTRYGQEG